MFRPVPPAAAQHLSSRERGALQSELFLAQRGVAIACDTILLPPIRLEISIWARHTSFGIWERIELTWLASLTRRQAFGVCIRPNRALFALIVRVRKRTRITLLNMCNGSRINHSIVCFLIDWTRRPIMRQNVFIKPWAMMFARPEHEMSIAFAIEHSLRNFHAIVRELLRTFSHMH